MPKYGRFKYGKLHKYGKYALSTRDGLALGDHVVYRIRFRNHDGTLSEYVQMAHNRIQMPTSSPKIRIRSNSGEWVYVQQETIDKETNHIRIRSVDSNGERSEWVESNRAELKKNEGT